MLHRIEPKIRRMEYSASHSPAAIASVLKPSAPITDDEARKETLAAKIQEIQLQAARIQDLERELSEQESSFALRVESARKEAFEHGRNEAESVHSTTLQRILGKLEQSLEEFRFARDSYLAKVEQEVVQLALGIAKRILHREAQMDPLLLSGAVRVALGQLADTTEVRLRVPESELELWSEMIRLMPNLPLRPQLIADDILGSTECTLETHLGSVDLGVKAQLTEIERGFFDLLERRGPARGDHTISANKREEA